MQGTLLIRLLAVGMAVAGIRLLILARVNGSL